MDKFKDRRDAGKKLAAELKAYAGRQDAIVLALPRGGVPVAFEVAVSLHLPLDVFIVRKLGTPGHQELAMGAIATGGVQVVNEDIVQDRQISVTDFAKVLKSEQEELLRREIKYRGSRPPLAILNKLVILVDDGIATGASMRVAVKALKEFQPAAIVIAVPVAEEAMRKKLVLIADEIICLLTPADFHAVGVYYKDFTQTTDEEVHELLAQSRAQQEKKNP
jgi:putative phosphoribosyl transferase